jgi:AcrR family transcriptional regulator
MQNENTTKDKILKAAARLFSIRGYDGVSTREIAKAVGINSASIYYYFASKEDILKDLYRYYSDQLQLVCPDLDELLQLAETAPPQEVLMKSEFHFSSDIRETLDQIIVTATRRLGSDLESEHFIRKNIFDPTVKILKPLLERLVESGKIKMPDIDTFICVLTNYCFSTAALNNTSFRQDVTQYRSAMSFLFSIITFC